MKPNPKAAVGDMFAAPTQPITPAPAVVDPPAGRERGIEGGEAAIAHADGVGTVGDPPWSERAWLFMRAWVGRQSIGSTFAVEDVRVAWEEAGNPVPPNNNSWGPLGRRLVREKVAVRAGYREAHIKSSNGRAVALYQPWAGREL
jgi:hypothetical protein